MTRAHVAELRAVLDRMADVLDTVRPLGEIFSDVVVRRRAAGRVAARDDLAELHGPISGVLLDNAAWVAGAGVVTAPGLLAGRPLHLEWWWRAGDGRPEPLRVNLDETAADFFDYTSAEWYAVPADTGRRHAAGPYVDYLCTNLYSITLTSPVRIGDELIGVVGADVPVSVLESMVLTPLARLGPAASLVTADGRVIASASPSLAPGHRVDLDRVECRPVQPRSRHRVGGLDSWMITAATG